jgi:hypothetical protein
MRFNSRGVAGIDDLAILVVVVVVAWGGLTLGRISLHNPFAKKPPVEQVKQMQDQIDQTTKERDAAKQDAAAARQQAKDAEADAKAAVKLQITDIQQNDRGAQVFLDKVAPEHVTAEVKGARSFLLHNNIHLVALNGKLSDDLEAQVQQLVADWEAGKEAEFNAAMAAKDKVVDAAHAAQVVAETKEQQQTQRADDAYKLVDQKDATIADERVKEKGYQQQISAWITKRLSSETLAADAQHAADFLFWCLIAYISLHLFSAWVAPGWLSHMPACALKTVLHKVTGILAGGLHFIKHEQTIAKLTAGAVTVSSAGTK